MIVSSGAVCQQYEVIGLVVGFASVSEGCDGGIKVEETYRIALKRMTESAAAQGADGLIYVNFQNRVAVKAGCAGTAQAFEDFAWGTAIKLEGTAS